MKQKWRNNGILERREGEDIIADAAAAARSAQPADLFEGRPIISSYDMAGINMQVSSSVCTMFSSDPFSEVDLKGLNCVFTQHDFNMTSWEFDEVAAIASPSQLLIDSHLKASNGVPCCSKRNEIGNHILGTNIFEDFQKKANQKRALDDLVIQSGSYNTEFFKKLDPMELFSGHRTLPLENLHKGGSEIREFSHNTMGADLSNADVEAAIKQAEDEADYMALKRVEQEEAVDNQEFSEEAIGRLEDDDLLNEDDMKVDDKGHEEQSCWVSVTKQECWMSPHFEREVRMKKKESATSHWPRGDVKILTC
ncbi:hypothetical protein J5N97_003920 [Dioscorea zingiberensis]|uniref:Uncharacterized protein n=1 Tax=Dioscorea zingiberensis TaxID=325984 RepID=A0A9D5HQW3_9LILI|nr:hypothetical protein J5N97_003920 [Dioscorea zingiberensis]